MSRIVRIFTLTARNKANVVQRSETFACGPRSKVQALRSKVQGPEIGDLCLRSKVQGPRSRLCGPRSRDRRPLLAVQVFACGPRIGNLCLQTPRTGGPSLKIGNLCLQNRIVCKRSSGPLRFTLFGPPKRNFSALRSQKIDLRSGGPKTEFTDLGV